MFTSSLKESAQNEIELIGVDGEALVALVQYCYTGNIELREEKLELLFGTACLLQLNSVVESCCQFFIKELDPGNCLGIKMLAEAQGCGHLSNTAHAYALEHFVEMIKNQEYLSLPAQEVAKLLESDDVNVPSEETIFHALMTWLQHDSSNRCLDASKLFSCVKLPLLSPAFIIANIESNELLRNQKAVLEAIIEAFKYHFLPEFRPVLQSRRVRPRRSIIDVLVSIDSTSIETFSLEDNSWKNLGSMVNKRTYFGAAVIEKKLLVVGGVVAGKSTKTIESFDFSTKLWNTLSPMDTPRQSLGVAVLKGSLYAIGGFNGSSIVDTVERWDPCTLRWSYVAPLRTKRSGVGVAVVNNKLYAVGGLDGQKGMASVECYDPCTNTWTSCAPMLEPRRKVSLSVSVLDGYLYVLGGYDESCNCLDSVERYDPKTDKWNKVAPMSVAKNQVGACTINGRLFAVGGSDEFRDLTLVEVYDPGLNRWEEVSPLGVGRIGPCVAVKNSDL